MNNKLIYIRFVNNVSTKKLKILQQVLVDADTGTANAFADSATKQEQPLSVEKPTVTEIVIAFVHLAEAFISLIFWAAVL